MYRRVEEGASAARRASGTYLVAAGRGPHRHDVRVGPRARRPGRQPRGRPGRSLLDREELDIEDEHARRRARLALVGEVLRDPEAALLTDGHELDALGPAGDHVAERELGRLPAGERAVEHLSVG